MSRIWILAALVAAVAAGVGAAGCGGGDEESLTKAEYVKQANAICSKAVAQKEADLKAAMKEFENSSKRASDKEGEELITEVAVPPLQTMTEELADLGEPDTEGEQAEAVVSAFEDGIEEADSKTAAVLKGTVDPFGEAEKLAADYGLKACSET